MNSKLSLGILTNFRNYIDAYINDKIKICMMRFLLHFLKANTSLHEHISRLVKNNQGIV